MSDSERPAEALGGDERRADDSRDDDTARHDRAVELVRRAGRFTREHPDLTEFIFTAVEVETRQGRKTSLQWALEKARAHDFPTMQPGRTCVNNNLGAPFGRVFCRENPDLAPMVETRPSLVDMLTEDEFMHAWETEVA